MEGSRNNINVGMSIQERMKMLNQKPATEPKEKEVITTGVSVKERLAAMQANKNVDTAKQQFKPSEPFIPLSQRKANLQESKKESQIESPPMIKPQEKNITVEKTIKKNYFEENKSTPEVEVEKKVNTEEQIVTVEKVAEIHKNEEEKPELVQQHSLNSNVGSVKDRIKNMGNFPLPGAMGIRQHSLEVNYNEPEAKKIEKPQEDDCEVEEIDDGKLRLKELEKPVRKRNVTRVNLDFD